ncbi:6-aminohexanoate-dimer hydrolase [Falsiruegeria litorea R37]|uniref:6-aminohexanoate-dimer hydrolase n=1 Tax=Falsiruegeria litorea R37 TaxID=1200284 RepID=A0A1Y5S3B8_9RHOB|nr:serine hydrolase [Falsiruegeria litorea]SLN31670.1 6-aminohexanoate-dimer hydrolase [Falsiruegeria litorea R37]
MKWIERGAVAIVALALIGGAVFWDKIQDVRALMAYSAVFEPENIDQNFRTLYETYPSITIKRSGPVADFEVQEQANILPATFTYEGQELPTQKLFDAFHWTGLAVLKDGKLIHEAYARGNSAETHHIEMSVTKSLTSILVGVAHDAGDLDVDAQVTSYVPELNNSGYDGVTVQQVLDMTSGIRYVEDYDDLNSDIVQTVVAMLRGSLDEFSTTIVREREPGTFNQYASIETQVLAWVLRRATGQDYAQYFHDKLWAKIGAEGDALMLVDQTGEPVAFGGANLRLRDLARVGQMVLNGGVSMTGERVVSAVWLQQSVTTDTPQSMPGDHAASDFLLGYKNQWWIPVDRDGGDFMAIGIYGQFLYINPGRGVVIAMNAAYPEYNEKPETEMQMVSALQAIAKHVSPDS